MPLEDLRIVHEFPPNFELIKAAFPKANEKHVFCYDGAIYVPDGHDVPRDILFHESIHIEQQGNNPDEWWRRYVMEPKVRLEQELEAYGRQYKWLKQRVKGAQFLKWALGSMATALSGEVYGNLIGYAEAESKIRNYAKHIV